MKRCYSDIMGRIDQAPKWYDEHGVPRYCDFSPKEVDIYAHTAALVLIGCQNCGQTFKVAMSWCEGYLIKRPLDVSSIHYGDPPNIRCCPAGPTMNCDDLKILEWWDREGSRDWRRVKEKEVLLPDHPEYIE